MHATNNTDPKTEELDDLIKELAKSKPLVKFFRLLGVDPKSADAQWLVAYGLHHGLEDFLKERDLERAALAKKEGRS